MSRFCCDRCGQVETLSVKLLQSKTNSAAPGFGRLKPAQPLLLPTRWEIGSYLSQLHWNPETPQRTSLTTCESLCQIHSEQELKLTLSSSEWQLRKRWRSQRRRLQLLNWLRLVNRKMHCPSYASLVSFALKESFDRISRQVKAELVREHRSSMFVNEGDLNKGARELGETGILHSFKLGIWGCVHQW